MWNWIFLLFDNDILFICSFLGLSQSLQVTSYIKMIDIWMLFTMTVPFTEVVMHTINEVSRRPSAPLFGLEKQIDVVKVLSANGQDEEETKKHWSMILTGRLILPITSLIFTTTFSVVGLVQSYKTQEHEMFNCLKIDLN